MILTIIAAVLVFGIIIAVHEAGHLIAAKSVGVKVHEFAIGMGPRLFSFTKGGTAYSLRLLPIGGFCSMEGEDENSDNPDALCNKSVWARLLVMVSGALMNVILGLLIYIIIIGAAGGNTIGVNVVDEVLENSPAMEAGLQPGDKVIRVNGKRVHLPSEMRFELYKSGGQEAEVVINRGGEKITKRITPYLQEEKQLDANGNEVTVSNYYFGYQMRQEKKTVWNVLSYAYYQSWFTIDVVIYSLGQLIQGKVGLNEMSGPVGIVNQIGQSARAGFLDLLSFMALITINLGVFNLLPIPALDGGRILFLIVEIIRRKPLNPEREGMVHFIGLVLLMILMIVVTSSDIIKLNVWDKLKGLFGG